MITLFSGSPGSGKSYHSVKEIIFWLNRNRFVITNLPLNSEGLRSFNKKFTSEFLSQHLFYLENSQITPEFLYKFSSANFKRGKERQCLLMFDEAGDEFNPRDWERSDRMSWLKFFRMHRHYGYDIILISQSDRYLDRQIRGVIEKEIKHRDIKNYKAFGKLLSLLSFSRLFICVEYWYPVRLKDSVQYIRLNRKIAKCYNTLQNFSESQISPQKRGTRFSAQGVPLSEEK